MTKPEAENIHHLPLVEARTTVRRLFVRDLVLPCRIGVHRHEKGAAQRICINLDLTIGSQGAPKHDRLSEVVCYERLVAKVREVVAGGHVNLVETLAERILETCLEDPRVSAARVRIEKLDVFADAAGAGYEVERVRGAV